jgi:hypothetical protein
MVGKKSNSFNLGWSPTSDPKISFKKLAKCEANSITKAYLD